MPRKTESQSKSTGRAKPKGTKRSPRSVVEVPASLKLDFRVVGGSTVLDITASGGVVTPGQTGPHPTRRIPVASYIQLAGVGEKQNLRAVLQLLLSPQELAGKGE